MAEPGANPEDALELVRLRAIMLADLTGTDPGPGPWQDAATRTLRTRLAGSGGSMAACVVDAPGVAGRLAACAVGTIEYRLGAPNDPTGMCGYVFNVVTDREHRRRGYSRACVTGLLAWYAGRGVARVDLRASAAGEPLYRSLGFVRSPEPSMRLTVPPRAVGPADTVQPSGRCSPRSARPPRTTYYRVPGW